MKNYTKNTAIGKASGRSAVATQQLSLFDSPLFTEQQKAPQNFESDKPYPLQISYIRDKDRTVPDRFCRLIHHESKLKVTGSFTYDEAREILRITRDWDWELNDLGIPRCRDKLLLLFDKLSSGREGKK